MRDTFEMAKEAGIVDFRDAYSEAHVQDVLESLKAFEALVRADERETFFTPDEAMIVLEDTDFTWWNGVTQEMVDKLVAIRNRGNT